MAHFAKINENNLVTQVLVINNTDCLDETGQESEAVGIAFCQSIFGVHSFWVQTSYNANFRGKYAGVGDTYDAERDAFLPPQPYPSWVLNEATCQWEAPVPYPEDGQLYQWDEQTGDWVVIAADQ
jgi:hypothetical protein